MAAIKFIKKTVTLDGGPITESLPASFFTGEYSAHTFIISAIRDGQALTLSGTVTASFVNANTEMVPISACSIVDGVAVVTLADSCYHVSGHFTLTIYVNGAAIYDCVSRIQLRTSTSAYDPSYVVPNLAEIQAEVAAMRAATTAATSAATAAGNVDIDMSTGANEATVTITRANGTTKSQTIRAVVGDDYEDLRNVLTGITDEETGYKAIDSWDPFSVVKYYDIEGHESAGGQYWRTTPLIPCYGFRAMWFHLNQYHAANVTIATIAFFDGNGAFVSGVYASELAETVGVYIGQCAIPDDAKYFCAVGMLSYQEQSIFTPKVVLYKYSVPVQFTDAELKGSETIYDWTTGSSLTSSNWWLTKKVPVNGFKSFTFHAVGFNGGAGQFESVTFFDAAGVRISGVFADISNGNQRSRTGTAPIPANAAFLALLYNAHPAWKDDKSTLTLHNPEETPINILCIGDSITEGALGNNTFTEDNYVNNMQRFLGVGFTSFNAGIGGANGSTYFSDYKSRISLAQTDVVVIMLGLNGNMEAGFFENDGDPDTDAATYPIAANTCKLIEWVWTQRANALVVLASPTYASDTTPQGRASEAQTELMSELVKRYHLPYIDIHNMMGVNEKNYATWLVSDKVHGTTSFYHKLGMAMANGLRAVLNVNTGSV